MKVIKIADVNPEMFQQLEEFKKNYGHVNVPAIFEANRPLGRWVAQQRYRYNAKELPASHIEKLESLGFDWDPAETRWNSMFDLLKAHIANYGLALSFKDLKNDPVLWRWVTGQRHQRRVGKMSKEHFEKLNSVGFIWSVYNGDVNPDMPGESTGHGKAYEVVTPEEVPNKERLYKVRDDFVQYNGEGPLPTAISKYVENFGEMPSYLQLPNGPVKFEWQEEVWAKKQWCRWSGVGKVPSKLLEYVKTNGRLPQIVTSI